MHRLHGEADADVQDDGEQDDFGQLAQKRGAGRSARLVSRDCGLLRDRHEF